LIGIIQVIEIPEDILFHLTDMALFFYFVYGEDVDYIGINGLAVFHLTGIKAHELQRRIFHRRISAMCLTGQQQETTEHEQ
jgi:hypothetical protein